jgi:SulP family sulfate permease
MELMKKILPGLRWFENYNRSDLSSDLISGLTIAFLLMPQGMAYAMVAGLPPEYGLYATIIPPVIYALLGTSNKISIGPVALDSILIITGLSAFDEPGSANYLELAITLTLMVGLIQALLGFARMGFITNFLSYPVILGYISAAALSIIVSQLENLLGLDVSGSNVLAMLTDILSQVANIDSTVLLLAMFSLAFLIAGKNISKRLPFPLFLLLIGMLLSGFTDVEAWGVAVVREIPGGLPHIAIPELSISTMIRLFPLALTVALVGYVGTMSICKSLEKPTDEVYAKPNQELKAVGFANLVGSLFHAFPVSASFSRSAAFREAGARTQLSSVISAIIITIILIVGASFFASFPVPKLVLSAVVVASVLGLFDYQGIRKLAAQDRKEFAICLITFLATLLLNIQVGLVVGVLLSIIMVIYRAANPHMTELGAIDNGRLYRNINRFKNAEIRDDILIFRFDAPIFFGNKDYFVEKLYLWIKKRKLGKLRYVLIEAESINSVDVSGLITLEQIHSNLKSQNIQLCIVNAIGPVRDAISAFGLNELASETTMFTSLTDAINYIDRGIMDNPTAALQTNI